MPALRSEDPARRGDHGRSHLTVATDPAPYSRPATPAEAQRRYRAGIRTGRGGTPPPVWLERNPRLALPFRPYVYRGTGADAYTGEVVL